MKTYGSVSGNDVVLLHRVAMSRLRSLLGVCNLLSGMYQTDEDYERIRRAVEFIDRAQEELQEVCAYDAPIRAQGIF